jgi:hypothetical protein
MTGPEGTNADGAGRAADRRRNVRWERVSEVRRDLAVLRDVGERLVSRSRAPDSVGPQPSGGDPERS